jgi:outer membrane biosynthesis protein TonB
MPAPEPEAALELPERVVRFIDLTQRQALPPAPAVEPPRPEQPEPKPEPQQVASEQAPTPPPVVEPAPAPEVAPRQRAEASGLLAFRESFADIAERRPAAQLGSAARVSNAGAGDNRLPTRALVTSLAPGSSGGINLASISRQVGGDGGGGGSLAGVEVGRVTSNIGEGAGGANGAGTGDRAWAGAAAGRTDEEIQIVFDRYKASLYRLYNRELRANPTLRGQMVLRLTIEPSGAVSFLELQSTDMKAPALVEQVLERVRTFDFGAKDVAAITIVYPIDFLPAA